MSRHRYADIVGAGDWGGPFFGAAGDPGYYAPPAPVDSPALAIGPSGCPLALRKPLGLTPKCIPAGGCATLTAVSQELFKPQLLILPKRVAIAVSITDMRAGIQPLLASADGEIPGEAFLADSENVTFNGWTVLPNQPIFVTFQNESDQDLVVKGAFWGWVASGNMMHLYGPNLSAQKF
jgi:hypothetical protein